MSKYSLVLRSDQPSLLVEFILTPGSHARIGSDLDAEICLPLTGLADVVCMIERDNLDNVYLSDSDGSGRHILQLPAVLPLQPYQFVLFQPVANALATAPTQATTVVRSRLLKRAIQGTAILVLVLLGCLLLVEYKQNGRSNAKYTEGKQVDPTSSVNPTGDSSQVAQGGVRLNNGGKEKNLPDSEVKANGVSKDLSSGSKADIKPVVEESKITESKSSDKSVEAKLDFEQLAKQVAPAVFMLEVKNEEGEVIGTGTAFAISGDGLAVTNFHVVNNGSSFTARTTQGAEFLVTKVVAVDEDVDLALILLKAQNLPFLELSDGGLPKIGAAVAVFGCPKGLMGTLSEGIISSIRSEGEIEGIALPNGGKLIQTTAAISSGSSGSPVIDGSGKFVGIAVSTIAGSAAQNLNFAIPVDALLKFKKESKLEMASALLMQKPQNKHTMRESEPVPNDVARADPVFDQMVKAINVADWIQASKLARGICQRHPESAIAHTFFGIALNNLELYDQAEIEIRASLAINPENGFVWGYLGTAQYCSKKTKEARESWRRALALVPDDASIWRRLATSYIVEQDFASAINPMENLRKVDRVEFERVIEVTRNLSFRSIGRDQLIAHFDAMTDAEADELPSVNIDALVTSLIDKFLRHGVGQDIQAELADYAPEVDPYFDHGRGTKASILKDITTYRAQWPIRTLKFIELVSSEQEDQSCVEAVFKLRYSASDGAKTRTGVVNQKITFRRFDDNWLVTSIETIEKFKE